ncbi:MAG: sensor histidine kinase [bacterium]|nr:sensor histidine kinase [bacterium]
MEQLRAKGKLRNKIFLMMALVSVVPIFTAGFLSVYSIRASHKIDVANLEDALIDLKRTEIKSFMADFINPAGGAFRLKTSGDESADVPLEQKIFFWKAISATFSAVNELATINLTGKETARFDRSHPGGVLDADLRDVSNSEEFLTARAGKDYIGPVRYVSGEPTVTIALPARSKNGEGEIFSVWIGAVNLSGVRNILQDIILGTTGYLYLVDSSSKVIGGSLNGPAASADLKDAGIVGSILSGKNFSGPDGQMRYKNFFGEEVVSAGTFMPEFNWGLVVEWPAKEADASVQDLIYKNLVIFILVLVAVVIVSILLATFIVRPIRALEKGTAQVAEGKFDSSVVIKTGDELEELGFAFNKMTVGLKRLEELKNEFVFIAAHELRTPVGAMKGYLTLILDGLAGPITDKTKDFIQKVVNSNQRLIQLVNDLLEVSRSEGGKLTIKVAPVDVVEPIKSVLVELQSLADKASVQMVYEPIASLPKVLADADRVKEVMVNLVGNSIKYMGPPKGEAGGSGIVTITHEVQGANLITHVADTGLGMSKEAQEKLFEKFYRVASDKTKDIQGTGLGLFIVKQIIEKMNGTISAYSESEGRGTTFSFTLPIAS